MFLDFWCPGNDVFSETKIDTNHLQSLCAVTSARPEEHRAEFIGELRTSRVTGQPERSGGKW